MASCDVQGCSFSFALQFSHRFLGVCHLWLCCIFRLQSSDGFAYSSSNPCAQRSPHDTRWSNTWSRLMWRDDQPVFPNTASSSPASFLPPIVTSLSCPNSAQGLLVRSTVAIWGRLLSDSSFEFGIVSLLQLAALTTIQARSLDTLCKCLSQQNLSRWFKPHLGTRRR
jgi:hypothetical protein